MAGETMEALILGENDFMIGQEIKKGDEPLRYSLTTKCEISRMLNVQQQRLENKRDFVLATCFDYVSNTKLISKFYTHTRQDQLYKEV